MDRIEVDGVGLGRHRDHRLSRLRIRYRPLDPLLGRLQTIEFEGLRLQAGDR
jgi:hypothetical protein